VKPATHVGECQGCGRTQMLPEGRLSLHGYTVRWGFFEGVCQGAAHPPLEVSKDLCIQLAAATFERLQILEATIAELEAPSPLDPRAWVLEYNERDPYSHQKPVWITVVLESVDRGLAACRL
jgi:hypothetical protein